MLALKRAQFPPHRAHRARIDRIVPLRCIRPRLLEPLQRERARAAVVRRHLVHDGHRVAVAPAAHEVLGRLVHREDEEAEGPADEHEPAHGKEEVAPALVLGPRACFRSRFAGEVPDERPGDLWVGETTWGRKGEGKRTREPISWPKAHQTERTVRRY